MAERVTLYKGDKIFYGGDMANQSDFGTVTRVIPPDREDSRINGVTKQGAARVARNRRTKTMAKKTVHGLLKAAGRNWWYHKKLREEGDVKKARKLERQGIRFRLNVLRTARDNGAVMEVGSFGWCVEYTDIETEHGNTIIETMSGHDDTMIEAAHLAGIRVVQI